MAARIGHSPAASAVTPMLPAGTTTTAAKVTATVSIESGNLPTSALTAGSITAPAAAFAVASAQIFPALTVTSAIAAHKASRWTLPGITLQDIEQAVVLFTNGDPEADDKTLGHIFLLFYLNFKSTNPELKKSHILHFPQRCEARIVAYLNRQGAREAAGRGVVPGELICRPNLSLAVVLNNLKEPGQSLIKQAYECPGCLAGGWHMFIRGTPRNEPLCYFSLELYDKLPLGVTWKNSLS